MRPPAPISGTSDTTATSAISLPLRTRSASVAGVIDPALAEAEQQRALRKPPERLDAWEAYQRGLWHFYQYTAQENQSALGFFRQAISLDPNFAPGHYGYGLALHWDIWFFSRRLLSE